MATLALKDPSGSSGSMVADAGPPSAPASPDIHCMPLSLYVLTIAVVLAELVSPVVFGFTISIKYLSLVILIVQNSALALMMRYSKTTEGAQYVSSTAVVSAEVMKCLCSLVLLAVTSRSLAHASSQLFESWMDWVKIGVPAILYTLQNNLIFISVTNLDAATFQISYQLKILTTAIFSVAMLGRHLARDKWISLVLLGFGVAMVQLSVSNPTSKAQVGNPVIGLISVLVACLMSGFAGVYFEKILKESKTSVWARNVQLSVYGTISGLIGVYASDGALVSAQGFFYGYTPIVWAVIANSALGGLLVAVVVKYADNILKGFATSISIILSSVFSLMFLGFTPNLLWILGASFVLGATILYSQPDAVQLLPK